ncbi:hypothetical protein B7463_g3233, partial [Scytalidium lignicola]
MPVKSLYPDLDIPDIDLFTFLFDRKDRPYADTTVLFRDSDSDRSYTYEALKSSAIDFGKGLRAIYGWKRGDILFLCTPNCIDTPVIIWGNTWAGGITSPANPEYTVRELAWQMKDSGAKIVVTQAPYLDKVREACERVGIPSDHILLINKEQDPTGRHKHFTSVRNTTSAVRFRQAKATNPAKGIAFLMYSSGTTGLPKGVMLSHRNIIANVLQIEYAGGGNLTSAGGDKLLACLPFFHIFGLTSILHQTVRTGFQTVVMPRYDIRKWCEVVQTHRITFVYVVPPIVVALAKHSIVSQYDLSSIKMMNSGAASLMRELIEAVYTRTGIPTKQGYGLTETSPSTHTQPCGEWQISLGSVGKMLPNLEARFMDVEEEGTEKTGGSKEVVPGEPGEIYLRGPNIFLGYWKRPEETRLCLSDDGWFRTGDVGFQDAQGDLYITDRVKELIKYKGFQVAPASLEAILTTHPAIDDAGVVGVWSQKLMTEVPRAYVVKRAAAEGWSEVRRQDPEEREWKDLAQITATQSGSRESK